MGNRKKIVAGITGAAALVVAPFIHNAFAAANNPSDDSPAFEASITTHTETPVPTSKGTPGKNTAADNTTKDKDSMPDVSVHTEINNGKASVTVNGQPVAMPEDGSTQTSVDNGNNSHTTISIINDGTSTSATTTTTSGNTRIRSHTSNSVNVSTKSMDTTANN